MLHILSERPRRTVLYLRKFFDRLSGQLPTEVKCTALLMMLDTVLQPPRGLLR
jgi:hypothetical protein